MKMRMIYTKIKEGKIKREREGQRERGTERKRECSERWGGGSRGTEIKREGFEIGGGGGKERCI